MTEQAPEDVAQPALSATEVFLIRDALEKRLADVTEIAGRFFPPPYESDEAAAKWREFSEFKGGINALLAKLPQVETPEGEPARFAPHTNC